MTQAINLSIWAADESEITTALPATFVFQDGQSVIGMAGDMAFGQELIEEGFTGSSDIEFRGLISRFTSKPALNSTATHVETGLKYRISTLKNGPENLTYIFGMVNLTK